jgi:serine/threonine protein kinase
LKEVQEGDPKYLAPEILISYNNITCASDVFSLGMTILELATDLDLPKQGPLWHELRIGKIPKEFTNKLSDELVRIIMLMIEPDHFKRATVDQLFTISSVKKQTNCEKTKKILSTTLKRIKTIFFSTYQLTISIIYFLVNPFIKFNQYLKQKLSKHDIEDQQLESSNDTGYKNYQNIQNTESTSTPKKSEITNTNSNLFKDATPNKIYHGNIIFYDDSL